MQRARHGSPTTNNHLALKQLEKSHRHVRNFGVNIQQATHHQQTFIIYVLIQTTQNHGMNIQTELISGYKIKGL